MKDRRESAEEWVLASSGEGQGLSTQHMASLWPRMTQCPWRSPGRNGGAGGSTRRAGGLGDGGHSG